MGEARFFFFEKRGKIRMKTVIFTIGCVVGQNASENEERNARRYDQFMEMTKTYWKNYDDKKLWSYGCNGFNRGDRPMSSPGYGLPIDELDRLYHTYKSCLMCARRVHTPANNNGDECIGEFVEYDASKTPRNQWKCNDQPGSCPRLLCECDLMFAQSISDAIEFYDKTKKHRKNGFDPTQDCRRAVTGGIQRCCGAPDKPMLTYNAQNKECCDGEIFDIGYWTKCSDTYLLN